MKWFQGSIDHLGWFLLLHRCPLTAELLPVFTTCHTPTPVTTTPTNPILGDTLLSHLPMEPSFHHISILRSSINTGITIILGYQVQYDHLYDEFFKFHILITLTINLWYNLGAYKRLDNEMLTSYYDRERSKSKSPRPMFYKSPSPQRSAWGGYF